MARLFQNIGQLAERVLPQINTEIPAVNQGSTTIDIITTPTEQGSSTPLPYNTNIVQSDTQLKIQPPVRSNVIDQLKVIGNVQEKNAVILKTIQNGINIDSIPVKYSFVLKPIANIQQQSPIIINFTDQMSLADRLRQTNLGTTQHLPQFFLSDVYTNYIRVVPFTFAAEQGATTVKPFIYVVNQGGLNPVPFNTIPIGGGVTPTLPLQDIRTLQGIVIANNIASSFVVLNAFNPILTQGSTTAELFQYTPIQGETTVTIINLPITQGETTVGLFDYTPEQGATIVTNFTKTPEQGGVTPDPFLIKIVQGETDPVLFSTTVEQGERNPQIVAYEIDKLAAIATPLLKHGTALIDTTVWPATLVDQGVGFRDYTSVDPNDEISTPYSSPRSTGVTVRGLVLQGSLLKAIDNSIKSYKDDSTKVGFDTKGIIVNPPLNPISILTTTEAEDISGQIVEVADINTRAKTSNLAVPNNTEKQAMLANYATLDYLSTARRAARPKSNEITDFRQDPSFKQNAFAPFNNGQNYENTNVYKRLGLGDYGVGGKDRGNFQNNLDINDSLYESTTKEGNDLVKLKFASVRDGITLQFRSYIKGFSEDYNVDYTDIEYIGRPDKLKLFKGNSRGGTVNFIVPAGTRQEVRVMHQKLNTLAQIVYGARYSDQSQYFRAPFIYLTVGDYYRKMPINITSLKYDTNPTEYPWEINISPDGKVGDLFEGPQFIDVSVTYNVIGHNLPLYNFDVIDTPNFNPSTGQNIPT